MATAAGCQPQQLWPVRHPNLQGSPCRWRQQQRQRQQLQQHHITRKRVLARQASSDTVALVSCDDAEADQLHVISQQQQQPVIEYLGNIDGMQTVRGVMQLPANADLLYSLLTDYESSTRVFSNIASTEVVFGEDGSKQVLQVSLRMGVAPT